MYFIYCKFFCSAEFASCWTWKHTTTHWKCAVTYALRPHPPGGSNGLLWQHNRRNVMIPDLGSPGVGGSILHMLRWHTKHTCCPGPSRAGRSTQGLQSSSSWSKGGWSLVLSFAGRQGCPSHAVPCDEAHGAGHCEKVKGWTCTPSGSSQSQLLFESSVPFCSLVKHPVWEAAWKERTRRVSTSEASGGLCKRLKVFSLWSTVVPWDAWELNTVVLLTFGLPHFSRVCTNNSVNNYKKNNWTTQSMKFQGSMFLILLITCVRSSMSTRQRMLCFADQAKWKKKDKTCSFSILLFTLEHIWHRKFLLFIEQLCQVWKPITSMCPERP